MQTYICTEKSVSSCTYVCLRVSFSSRVYHDHLYCIVSSVKRVVLDFDQKSEIIKRLLGWYGRTKYLTDFYKKLMVNTYVINKCQIYECKTGSKFKKFINISNSNYIIMS